MLDRLRSCAPGMPLAGAALASIAGGYALLLQPPGVLATVWAPVLLVAGYCLLLPLALVWRRPPPRHRAAGGRPCR